MAGCTLEMSKTPRYALVNMSLKIIKFDAMQTYIVQGASKRLFPGCENMWWKNCVFLPAAGKQNATVLPDFTQPGKSLSMVSSTDRFIVFTLQQETLNNVAF